MADNSTHNRKFNVFLCHSSNDKEKVEDLYYKLRSDGYDPWLDEKQLLPGQEWDLRFASLFVEQMQ